MINRPTIQDLLDHKLTNLPPINQEILNGEQVDNLVLNLQEELSLIDTEVDDIAIEIAYVLFEVTPIEEFKDRIEDSVGKGGNTATRIVEICNKEIFSKIAPVVEKTNQTSTESSSLNHVDILNEIENPTPSIVNKEQPAQETPEIVTPVEVKKPTLEEALSGVLPSEGGFAFTDNTHPAEPMAQKLEQKLSGPTTSTPKEIYVVKKPDPYHEPIE